ncbi:MAG: glutamyl-tRNA reductase [Bacteroidetes bacterium]|nr:glutamyl-tRNA reductase [Bacteroidota bacterium]
MQISDFFVVGINYKKTDTITRGQFSLLPQHLPQVYDKAKKDGLDELFILSTCNRTEVYGISPHIEKGVELLCNNSSGDLETFEKVGYRYQGEEAIQHLFKVGAGLDSQILGDYEIVAQLKQALKNSKENQCTQAFLDRLGNFVLQASKAVKNNTGLSSGSISVSFSTIKYLQQNINNINEKNILLVGAGKIGESTCKNLVDYLQTKKITLINRNESKSFVLSQKLGINYATMENLPAEIMQADIIIVATSSEKPLITDVHITDDKKRVFIDLSIPNNIDPAIRKFKNVSLINVDELSVITDETLQNRVSEMPKALQILQDHQHDFMEWFSMRQNVPVLKAAKKTLKHLDEKYFIPQDSSSTDSRDVCVQKVINAMAKRIKHHATPGCDYIHAIHDFVAIRTN